MHGPRGLEADFINNMGTDMNNSYAARLERGFEMQEQTHFERLFYLACAALGEVDEALGIDPDEGGAAPIIKAIQYLTDEIIQLKGEAGVLRDLLDDARSLLIHLSAPDDYVDELADKIRAALLPVAQVQFLPPDDTEGGAL
jgi:hypothetical protein